MHVKNAKIRTKGSIAGKYGQRLLTSSQNPSAPDRMFPPIPADVSYFAFNRQLLYDFV